ncbi:MAG: DUF3108 domain-containing protein [Myxococcaceae bacterium]
MRAPLIAALVLASSSAFALDPAKVKSVFGPGEQTTYEVSYLGFVAGRAQLTVGWSMEQFGHEVWPLVCLGETTKTAAGLWPIKDRFISYWDPLEQRAVGSDFFVQENTHKHRERYQYDLSTKQAIVTRYPEGKEPWQFSFDNVAEDTRDLAAAGFSLRNVPLVVGAVHQMPIFTGVKLYQMKATVIGRETIDSSLGEVEVYKVTVNGDFNGKLATQGLITLYYTADEKQLPVRAEADFLFGKVLIDAVKYEQGRVYRGGAQ